MGTNVFSIVSSAFTNNGEIPVQYTCNGQNYIPPLDFMNIPIGTASLAVIVHDPDAPHGDFLHWLIWNIDPASTHIQEKWIPEGAVQGSNDGGSHMYMGPCPPSGMHRYVFELYALDTLLDIPANSSRQAATNMITAHMIAQAKLTGTYSANNRKS